MSVGQLDDCRSYCKGKNLKANHNTDFGTLYDIDTVAATAKVRI